MTFAPTALFCGNDVLAVGAVLEAQHMGLKVPQNISIVGFDDLPLSAHMSPGLTTVHVPSRRMANMPRTISWHVSVGESPDPRNKLPTDIMIRGTTAPPSKT